MIALARNPANQVAKKSCLEVSRRSSNIQPSEIRVVFEKAQRMNDVIRFEVGEPDFQTPSHIKDAAKKAIDEGFTHYT